MDKVEMIKNSINMTDIVNHYAPRKIFRGRCACPLHNGKNQNFKLYADSFYCFKCGAGGDLIKFVSLYFGITYPEAIDKIGIDFALFGTDDVAKINNSQRLIEERKLERERLKELESYSDGQKWILTDYRRALSQTGKFEKEVNKLDEILDNVQGELLLTSATKIIEEEVMLWD
ncbi:MAG: CHC2 zinc finger domain-containing protein [Anaerovoracaceae bacterium]